MRGSRWSPLRDVHRALLAKERGHPAFRPEGGLRICLVYPNLYAVAMGNLGFQAVHRYLNQLPGVSCERAVLPEGPDLRRLDRADEPIPSLETGTPLGDFDVLAFSVTYELDYLNLVRMLARSKIPADRTRRNRFHPIVVAGGAALTVSHEPLRPILDGWFRGEAEGRLGPWVDRLVAARGEGLAGDELRAALAEGEGCDAGAEDRSFQVVRERGGDALPFEPVGASLVTPEGCFGDAALVEICRGCPWRCHFCVAKDLFGSFRKATHEAVLDYAARMRPFTARLGVIGAGMSAYPGLARLMARLRETGYSVSVSSLRLDRVDQELLEELARHGQKTLTVAPETFSDRMQPVTQKSLDLEKLVRGLRRAGPIRFEKIKMYMIAGLPGDTLLDQEVAFATVERLTREGALAPGQVELSYSVLLPRPGTELAGAPLMEKRQHQELDRFLTRRGREAGVGIKLESWRMAMLCDLLCRGDQRVGERLLAWIDRCGGQQPFELEETDYRAYMEPLLAGGAAWLAPKAPAPPLPGARTVPGLIPAAPLAEAV